MRSNFSHILPTVGREGLGLDRAVTFFDDFITGGYCPDLALANESDPAAKFSEVADRGEWLVTIVDGGGDNDETVAIDDDAHGGVLKLGTTDADNDELNLQLNGESFKFAADRRLVFEARVKLNDVDTADWFIGLAITDTTVLAGCTDFVGFRCPDATGDIDYAVGKDAAGAMTGESSGATSADSTKNLADDTYVTLRFEVDGTSKVRFYVDGAYVGEASTNLPDNETLTPTIALRNASAAKSYLHLDYLLVVADR